MDRLRHEHPAGYAIEMARLDTWQPETIRRYDVPQGSTLLSTKRKSSGQQIALSSNLLHATNGLALHLNACHGPTLLSPTNQKPQ